MDHRERVYQRYASVGAAGPFTSADAAFAGYRPYLRRLVARHFPADRSARILDLGCGTGTLVHFAREAGYTGIEGVDGSAEQVAVAARAGIPGIRTGDLFDEVAGVADSSLDAVVTFDVIEHLTTKELVALTDHVARVLRPGGRWIVHVPNGEALFAGRIRYADITHERAFTRGSLRQLLLTSGFARVDCFEDRPVPHGPVSAVRWLLWGGIRLVLRFLLAVETGNSGRDAIFSQNLLAVACKG